MPSLTIKKKVILTYVFLVFLIFFRRWYISFKFVRIHTSRISPCTQFELISVAVVHHRSITSPVEVPLLNNVTINETASQWNSCPEFLLVCALLRWLQYTVRLARHVAIWQQLSLHNGILPVWQLTRGETLCRREGGTVTMSGHSRCLCVLAEVCAWMSEHFYN